MPGKIHINNCLNSGYKYGSIFSQVLLVQLFSVILAHATPMELGNWASVTDYFDSFENDSSICCSDTTLISGSIGETGVAVVTDAATVINLSRAYTNPVVITGGMNRSGAHFTTIRIDNMTSTQFEMRLIDWECHNPGHGPEEVPYMVVEAGVHILSNGAKLIAQNYSSIDHTWSTLPFPATFSTLPAIFGQCISEEEPSPLVVSFDQNNLQLDQFAVRIRESGVADGVHLPERVSVIAMEKGIYEYESMSLEVNQLPLTLTNTDNLVTLERDNLDAGTLIAGIQSVNSVVPATLNIRFSTPNSVLMRLDFEKCSARGDSIEPELVNYINIIGEGDIVACISDTSMRTPAARIIANPVVGNPPLEVSFNASTSSDPNGSLIAYFWDFGDGNTGNQMEEFHTYADTGSYTATLIVTDDEGLKDTSTVEIRVFNPNINLAPLAVFTADPYEGQAPLSVSFDATSSIDIDGSIISYKWSFGDGTSGTGNETTHTFQQNGAYTVQLVVFDDQGLTDTSELIIRVGLDFVPPLAAFSVSEQNGVAPFPVLFDASLSTDPDGEIISYTWYLGSDILSDEESFAYEFATAGNYIIQLVVADNDNLLDTASIEISVLQGNNPPNAEFTYIQGSGQDFQVVSFDASASNDPDGSIQTYSWDFGDGKEEVGKIVSHTFPNEGTYRVRLEVADDSSATDTFSVNISIKRKEEDTTQAVIDCKDSTWVIGEVGFVQTTDQNTRVILKNSYKNPVVVTGGFKRSGSHHTTIRIQGLTPSSFDIRLIDWECRNPGHGPEQIPYMVVESGSYLLPNGKRLMAGNYGLVTHEWGNRLFPADFDQIPSVFGQVLTENESDPVVVQFDRSQLTKESFTTRLRENRTSDTTHAAERIGIIAFESGSFQSSSFSFETSQRNLEIGRFSQAFSLRQFYEKVPIILGAIQTTNEDISATVHIRGRSSTSVEFSLDYENCSSLEEYKLKEELSYIAFETNGDIYACGLGTGIGGEGGLEDPEAEPNNQPALRFQVFPIPTQTEITLMLEEEGSLFEYQVINYAGQRVAEGTLKSGENVVNVEKLSPGIYLMNVYKEQAMSSLEFVIY